MHKNSASYYQHAEELRRTIPPVPTDDSLARMRVKTDRAVRNAESRAPGLRAWRIAGTITAAAAVLAVGVFAVSPALENRAFARDEAADALIFARDGRVTHVVTRMMETGWTEEYGHDERYDLDQRTEEWYDPANERLYHRTVNIKDGSLDGVYVRVGDREARFANNVRYMTGDEPQLFEGTTSVPFGSTIGYITDFVRELIANGDAKVNGTQMVDGVECWIVTYDENELARKLAGEKPDPRSSSIVTVTLRKSDYLITSWQRDSVGYNGNGKTTGTLRFTFERWEYTEPGTLDEGLFSLDAVKALAPADTKVVNTVDGAAIE